MGRSKLDLPFAGTTFLGRVSDAAREAFDEVFAVQRAGLPAIEGIETIHEREHQQQAPIFGVERALEHGHGKIFILAIDYPLITAALLQHLRDAFTQSKAALLAPAWNSKLQMLCAGYDTALLPALKQRLAAGRLDLKGLIGGEETEIVAEDELRALFHGEPLMNVNTPDELEEARRLA